MRKARKLLSIGSGLVITMSGIAAGATGNLMAPPPKEERPKPTQKPDAGTPAPGEKEKPGSDKK